MYMLWNVYIGIVRIVALEFCSVFFAVVIALMTSKIQIGNPLLNWLGKYTFEIYILQRLPMIVFQRIENKYLYFGGCLTVTILLAIAFKHCLQQIEKRVIRKKLLS